MRQHNEYSLNIESAQHMTVMTGEDGATWLPSMRVMDAGPPARRGPQRDRPHDQGGPPRHGQTPHARIRLEHPRRLMAPHVTPRAPWRLFYSSCGPLNRKQAPACVPGRDTAPRRHIALLMAKLTWSRGEDALVGWVYRAASTGRAVSAAAARRRALSSARAPPLVASMAVPDRPCCGDAGPDDSVTKNMLTFTYICE